MKVLIACEESQTECIEFRKRGHEAYSCDLQNCSGGHEEWHIVGDVLNVLRGGCSFTTQDGKMHSIDGHWDLVIAHPPCTYLSNAGANHLYRPKGVLHYDRFCEGLKGKIFFLYFWLYGWFGVGKIAIENPMPSGIYEMPEKTQIIQPYEFGEPWSKKTYLWLFGLPPLLPTEHIDNYKPYCTSGNYSKTHDPKYSGCSRVGGSGKARSKSFKGISKAMAEQWG